MTKPQRFINLRGTSGAGKTTLARAILNGYEHTEDFFREGRKQPIYSVLQRMGYVGRPLMVLGHYRAACGGCDTITELDDVFRLVRVGLEANHDVLFEGLILSGEIARTLELGLDLHSNGKMLHVLALDTPVDRCVSNINLRREARGQMEPVRPKNTIAKARCVELTMKKLTGQPGLACGVASYGDTQAQVEYLLHG